MNAKRKNIKTSFKLNDLNIKKTIHKTKLELKTSKGYIMSSLKEKIAASRSDLQNQMLADFYKERNLMDASNVAIKIAALEVELKRKSNVTPFSFNEKKVDPSAFELIVLKNLENAYLARKGAMFLKYA